MGASWFIRPETKRLQLSDEQWILVRQRLSTGEYRAHMRRSSTVDAVGVRRIDSLAYGPSLVVAYLLDWSLDATIRDCSESDLTSTLDSLTTERFAELLQAIEAHEGAMVAERVKKKATSDGLTNSDQISTLSSEPEPDLPSTKSAPLM